MKPPLLQENGIEYLELKVGTDGLSVMVSPQNDFVDCLTMKQLHEIWKPGSAVQKWSDVNPEWPDRDIILYGADTDSGTFDYFTEEVNGESKVSRDDYTASADDNVLVRGIGGDRNSLGYFGYAYYIENVDQLKLLGVDNGEGCVKPSPGDHRSRDLHPAFQASLHLRERREPARSPKSWSSSSSTWRSAPSSPPRSVTCPRTPASSRRTSRKCWTQPARNSPAFPFTCQS